MDNAFYRRFDSDLEDLRKQGLFKAERVIASPQGGQIRANDAVAGTWSRPIARIFSCTLIGP